MKSVLIDQYRFHGHKWSATHGRFYFTGMDDCYWPRPTTCRECSAYSEALEEWKSAKKERALIKQLSESTFTFSQQQFEPQQLPAITQTTKSSVGQEVSSFSKPLLRFVSSHFCFVFTYMFSCPEVMLWRREACYGCLYPFLISVVLSYFNPHLVLSFIISITSLLSLARVPPVM